MSRHREELQRTQSVYQAMRQAVHGSLGAVTASAATVAVALLCLLASDLNSNRSLGPIAATGISFAWLASLTMLPALLYCFGRAAYWPSRPRYLGEQSDDVVGRGVWVKVADKVERRPRGVWIVTVILLLIGAAWITTLKAEGVPQSEIILGQSDAKAGQALINKHFDAGSGAPTTVITSAQKANEVLQTVRATSGVASAALIAADGSPAGIPPRFLKPAEIEGRVLVQATLAHPADSVEAGAVVIDLRSRIHALDAQSLVGGTTAIALDSNATARRDLVVIIPLVLIVVLLILIVLLRAILLPLMLVAATVLSFGTAMGTAAIVFNHVLGYSGADPTVPLYGFVFLVALGIDYTIFLMTRAREEAIEIGTRQGVLKSLVLTGGVITSAGIVLAATFSALAVIPLMFMVQLAFIVAYGVMIDTLIVRTLLIPGLVLDIGPAVWWPFVDRVEGKKPNFIAA